MHSNALFDTNSHIGIVYLKTSPPNIIVLMQLIFNEKIVNNKSNIMILSKIIEK